MRLRAATVALAFTVASCLSVVVPASAGESGNDVAFRPGPWVAQVYFRGALGSDVGTTSVSGSHIFFTVTISEEGKVLSGEMEVDISFSAEADDVTSTARETGTLVMTGTASRLLAAGTLHLEQVSSDGVITIPISRDIDTAWEFSPDRATCGQVTGELFKGGRDIQAAAGFESSIESKFRALPDLSDDLEGRLADLDAKVSAALAGGVTSAGLLELVRTAEAIRAEIALLVDCKKVPKSFKTGGSGDAWLEGILISLLTKALETPEAYDAEELISLLNTGVRGGAVGASSSDQEAAGQLLSDFDDALSLALGAAINGGDTAAIKDIYVAALQFGMSALAAEAKAAL